MNDNGRLATPDTQIPLYETTWNLDHREGDYINHLKSTHTEALAEPIVEVPEDLKNN